MPIERKYGKVTLERGSVEDDEPVFVFRARDWLSVMTLAMYRDGCYAAGSPAKHLELIEETIGDFTRWQRANPGKMKVPESASYEAK